MMNVLYLLFSAVIVVVSVTALLISKIDEGVKNLVSMGNEISG